MQWINFLSLIITVLIIKKKTSSKQLGYSNLFSGKLIVFHLLWKLFFLKKKKKKKKSLKLNSIFHKEFAHREGKHNF
jgi:hypothetical protein